MTTRKPEKSGAWPPYSIIWKMLFLVAAYCIDFTRGQSQPVAWKHVDFKCPPGYTRRPGSISCYKFYSKEAGQGVDWDLAGKQCAFDFKFGKLLVIDDEGEFDFIKFLWPVCKGSECEKQYFWVGATNKGSWEWIDESPLPYNTPWDVGYPVKDGKCAALAYKYDKVYFVNAACYVPFFFICEADLTPDPCPLFPKVPSKRQIVGEDVSEGNDFLVDDDDNGNRTKRRGRPPQQPYRPPSDSSYPGYQPYDSRPPPSYNDYNGPSDQYNDYNNNDYGPPPPDSGDYNGGGYDQRYNGQYNQDQYGGSDQRYPDDQQYQPQQYVPPPPSVYADQDQSAYNSAPAVDEYQSHASKEYPTPPVEQHLPGPIAPASAAGIVETTPPPNTSAPIASASSFLTSLYFPHPFYNRKFVYCSFDSGRLVKNCPSNWWWNEQLKRCDKLPFGKPYEPKEYPPPYPPPPIGPIPPIGVPPIGPGIPPIGIPPIGVPPIGVPPLGRKKRSS